MALLQTFNLEHLPSSHALHIALFHRVKNASFIHQQLLSGNTEFEYAFIDADVILSKVHALAAAYRAVNDLLEGRLRSRNVHSEIVFSLSPNNNIADSFRRFGITPSTSNLLVMKVSSESLPTTSDAVQAHLSRVIEGEQVAFEDENLGGVTPEGRTRVRKLYKLGNAATVKGVKGTNGVNGYVSGREDDGKRELEMLILGSMALRGATN